MSGRINPREYDLGELRDAADERIRNEESVGRTNGNDRRPGERHERDRKRSVELTDGKASRTRTGRTRGSVAENPETYLRARNRRMESPEPTSRAGSTPEKRSSRSERSRDRTGRETEATHRRTGGTPRACANIQREPPRAGGQGNVDFELLSHRSTGDVSRPYLDTLPETFGAQQEIFEWLEFLVSRAGTDGARSALEYYESIEWLSAESRGELERFVDGFNAASEADGSLGISEHRESLVYVARLAGRQG